MEVNKLDNEELQYELKIRGFEGIQDIKDMRMLLRGLLKNGDGYSENFVILDDKQEINACVSKIRDLKELVDRVTGTKLDDSYRIADTKLCHLLGRIDRITTTDEKLIKTRSILLKTILHLMKEMESKMLTFPDPLKATADNIMPVTRTLTVTKNMMQSNHEHYHSHMKNGNEEVGEEIFSHHGVALKKRGSEKKAEPVPGTLSIFHYKSGKSIEWKATEVSFETDNTDAEWDVVDTVRRRTCSTSSNFESCHLTPSIRIPMANLRSYKIKHARQVSLQDSNNTRYSFLFQNDNSDRFICALRCFLNTRRAGHSRTTYIVIGERKEARSNRSFADLNIFPENHEQAQTYVWNFVRNLQTKPYETTLQTFSKLTDVVLYRGVEQRPVDEEVAELLTKSFHIEDNEKTAESDFTIIESKKIALRPRPIYTRQSPLNLQQWISFMDSEGRINDPEAVKQIIFKGGMEHSLRSKVWKYLLNYYPWSYTTAECDVLHKDKMTEYFTMKKQWMTMTPGQEERFSGYRERKNIIEKDVNRTDRTMEFYAGENNPNLTILSDILMTYVMYNFDIGYVQGMSDLLSPILCLLKNEVDAFWCFVGFMEKVGDNFNLDQARMKKQLSDLFLILKLIAPDLAAHLQKVDAHNMFFCFRWLLVWFKREYTLQDIMTLWEVLWTDLPCQNFHLLISAAILDMEKSELMKPGSGFTEILKYVNELSMRMNLPEIINQAEGIYIQIKEAGDEIPLNIRRIIGLAKPEENDSAEENDSDNSEEEAMSFNPNGAATSSKKTSDDNDSVADDMERVTFARETGEIGFEGFVDKAMALNYY